MYPKQASLLGIRLVKDKVSILHLMPELISCRHKTGVVVHDLRADGKLLTNSLRVPGTEICWRR